MNRSFFQLNTCTSSLIFRVKLFHYKLCQPWHLVHICIYHLAFKSCGGSFVAVKGYRARSSLLHTMYFSLSVTLNVVQPAWCLIGYDGVLTCEIETHLPQK